MMMIQKTGVNLYINQKSIEQVRNRTIIFNTLYSKQTATTYTDYYKAYAGIQIPVRQRSTSYTNHIPYKIPFV